MIRTQASIFIQQLHSIALIGSPYLFLILYLLTVKRVFLHLLVYKNYGLGRRKFLSKIFEDVFGYEFIKCMVNDWKTSRNTQRNSVKIIDAPGMLEKELKKKKSLKMVEFKC